MQNRFIPLVFGGDGGRSPLSDLGLLVVRVFAGLALGLGHGLKKVPPSDRFVEMTGELGFPLPELFAWAAGLSELAGGILLALGLFTRPASALIAITMLVAAFGQHAGDPFGDREMALLYLVIAVAFMLIGSGRYGIDRLLHRQRDDRIWR